MVRYTELAYGIVYRILTMDTRSIFCQDLTFYPHSETERFGHFVLGHD